MDLQPADIIYSIELLYIVLYCSNLRAMDYHPLPLPIKKTNVKAYKNDLSTNFIYLVS